MGRVSLSETLSLAIPSRGRISDHAIEFLARCGMGILRPNQKQYSAIVPSMPDVRVHLQRAADIIDQISDRNADIGITGYDLFLEHRREGSEVVVLHDDLGFSRARLELAVPDSWVDVSHINDLAELALIFRREGRDLRVATSYPHLVRDFLLERRINNFGLTETGGSVEAAPALGSADIIADIVETGTALSENRLKTLTGGTILESNACVVGNAVTLKASREKRAIIRRILELIDAHLDGKNAFTLTANVRGWVGSGSRAAGVGQERARRHRRTISLEAIFEIRRRPHILVCHQRYRAVRVRCCRPWIISGQSAHPR